jgi:hypothetical protein
MEKGFVGGKLENDIVIHKFRRAFPVENVNNVGI